MKGALIALAIGCLIIFLDWRMATPADPKTKRRKPLSPTDKKRLWDLFVATLVAAAAAWLVPKLLD